MVERAPELEDLMRRWYAAIAAGDGTFVERVLSRQAGLLGVGTDPREWWAGYDTAGELFDGPDPGAGRPAARRAGRPAGPPRGERGLGAGCPTFHLPDGTELALRVTAVFRQEDGAWRCVQWHVSIGVGNEEALGQDLTV